MVNIFFRFSHLHTFKFLVVWSGTSYANLKVDLGQVLTDIKYFPATKALLWEHPCLYNGTRPA